MPRLPDRTLTTGGRVRFRAASTIPLRRASLRVALCAAALAAPIHGHGWLVSARHEVDGENLIWMSGTTVGVTGLQTPVGSFDLFADSRRGGVLENDFGLNNRLEHAAGFRLGYALRSGPYEFAATAGLSELSGWKDHTLIAEISRRWIPDPRAAFHLHAGYTDQIDKENPVLTALEHRAREPRATLGLNTGPWAFEFSAGARFHEGVSGSAIDRVLQDSGMVSELPENQVRSAYLYGYRRTMERFYLGAFASWADSDHDLYERVHLSPPQRSTFMYFPYDTPLDAYAAGAVLQLNVDLEASAVPLGSWTVKTAFPLWSTRRQHYETDPAPGVPVYQGYYTLRGTAPWTAEVAARKRMPAKSGLAVAYRFLLKPYEEYGYFRGESYRMHAVEVRLTRP